ncbi:hypothetical protein EB795_07265 [Pseudomonas mandelii]|nr:hypothetical protein [Pseudomonas mandelii]
MIQVLDHLHNGIWFTSITGDICVLIDCLPVTGLFNDDRYYLKGDATPMNACFISSSKVKNPELDFAQIYLFTPVPIKIRILCRSKINIASLAFNSNFGIRLSACPLDSNLPAINSGIISRVCKLRSDDHLQLYGLRIH